MTQVDGTRAKCKLCINARGAPARSVTAGSWHAMMAKESFVKATWHGHVVAESDQTIELDGYRYFPPASVRMEFLHAAPKTEADQRCPHSVQFFNLSDGTHSSQRAAWAYQAPRTSHARIAHWVGFWNDVQLQH